MALKNLKNLWKDKEPLSSEDEFYALSTEDALKGLASEGTKLILLEPRAFSESQQIADHLKNRHTVIVNLRRVTTDQAKRIVDFLSGTIYAIGGDLQKIGGGIFLCAPKNMSVQGKMAEDDIKDKIHDNSDIDVEIK
ncbi:MAG: cell division protein SepF [Tenericutes bacterium]|jgi:cell division inhibitor SepF|nr:cell division protein SepF [Bacilli bacterium]MDD4624081.1 cell division protein SepF [Bacilli bacterium]MDD4831424.1 cell division protein SepF [Bacilli bacterium]NLV90052.1 cell division protein SepF [Mycoplasmatota bacterium]